MILRPPHFTAYIDDSDEGIKFAPVTKLGGLVGFQQIAERLLVNTYKLCERANGM